MTPHPSGVCVALVAALALSALPECAAAQGAGAEPFRRLELAAGAGLMSGAALGDADANLRGRDGHEYRLFRAASDLGAAALFEVRAGVALTSRYTVEARFAYSRPELRSSVSDDVEGAPPITVGEQLDRYVVDAALLVSLPRFRAAGFVPSVSAGAGYLRELHEGLTLVEQGVAYHAGGSVKRPLFARRTGFVRGGGIRADARLYLLSGGARVNDEVAPHATGSAGFFLTF